MSRLVTIAIVIAGLVPATAYTVAGRWGEALLSAIIATAWLGGLHRRIGWIGSAGLLGLVALAGFGVLSAVPPGWGLVGVVSALVAWDLSGFAQVAQAAGRVVDERGLWQTHLRRLAIIAGGGLLLGATALLVRVELGFGWLLLFGIIAVIALSRAVIALRDS